MHNLKIFFVYELIISCFCFKKIRKALTNMSLLKLRTAPFVVIIDDSKNNIIALLLDLLSNVNNITAIISEQPETVWKRIFSHEKITNFICYNTLSDDIVARTSKLQGTVFIESIVQIAMEIGWRETLNYLIQMKKHENVKQLIVVLHRDCLSHTSVIENQLSYLASAIISYDIKNNSKINITLKKSGKLTKSEEILSYDFINKVLKSSPIVKDKKTVEEEVKPSPASLSTFKIEVDQTSQLAKHNLKLPYMNKIHEGQSRVFYEPDAVDDWDEEDPDDDLDI